MAFSLFDGELHRIAADYDQSQTEGWTAGDFVEAISPAYGTGARPAPAKVAPQSYGDPDEPVGVLKRLEAPDRAAILEAARLDEREAPLREADRVTKENDVERARLERAGLVNNPKFRP